MECMPPGVRSGASGQHFVCVFGRRRRSVRFRPVLAAACTWRVGHADVVAAINILERGLSLLACGELAQSGHSMKQEPTEALQASS